MLIAGLQKLSLLDFPEKMAATVFFAGCNFRCPFCHNAPLVTEADPATFLSEQEVLDALKKRRGFLDGVCVTGGEPLLQKELPDFLCRVKEMGYLVKLDTNGFSPEGILSLIGEGLVDYVAMDIKNAPDKYPLTVGLPDFDLAPIRASAALLMEDRVDYEFRTTVVREFHTEEDIRNIALWLSGAKKYFLQKFEDSGHLIGQGLSAHEDETMRRMLEIARPHFGHVGLRGVES